MNLTIPLFVFGILIFGVLCLQSESPGDIIAAVLVGLGLAWLAAQGF